MNSETRTSKNATSYVVVGTVVFGIYCCLMQTLSTVQVADFRFTFFPIPKFPCLGQLAFLLFVVVIGMAHIKLAFEQTGWQRRTKVTLGVLLMVTPIMFRAIAIAITKVM